jgi:hypothetical protein
LTGTGRSSLNKPLDRITVLDLTVALAGPFATLILAGLGAKVIQVENPAGGDSCRTNAPYLRADGPKLTCESEDKLHRINAALVLTPLGTRPSATGNRFIEFALERAGIPVLPIFADMADARSWDAAGMRRNVGRNVE